MARAALDFSKSLHADRHVLFAHYDRPDVFGVLPTALKIATDDSGVPEFELKFVRGNNPLLPPKPYARLQMSVTTNGPMTDALRTARDVHPQASVCAIQPLRAALALTLRQPESNDPAQIERPQVLSWNGMGVGRFSVKTSTETGNLIQQALADTTLTLECGAALEIPGIAPRVDARVEFDRLKFAEIASQHVNEQGWISRQDLVALLQREKANGQFVWHNIRAQDVAHVHASTLADHMTSRMGGYDVLTSTAGVAAYRPPVPADTPAGAVRLDLNQKTHVSRIITMRLHPIDQARELLDQIDLEQLVSTVNVPPIRSGRVLVSVSANLPPTRRGVLQLGVELNAPPFPPGRTHAIVHEILFSPDDKEVIQKLKFSPREPMRFNAIPFAIVRQEGGAIERLNGPEIPIDSDRVDLQPDVFPVQFVVLECTQVLMDLAETTVELRRSEGVANVERFTFSQDASKLALATFGSDESASLTFVAVEHDGERTVSHGPVPLQNYRIGLTTFVEYGPHTVNISCEFDGETDFTAIEIRSEETSPEAQGITVLRFSPEQPARTFSYSANSPFAPGYCYRFYRHGNQPQLPWSEPLAPGRDLTLKAGASSIEPVVAP